MRLMDSLGGDDAPNPYNGVDGRQTDYGMSLHLTSEPINNFVVDSARVEIKGVDGSPKQIIGKATHTEGLECYVAINADEGVTDQEIATKSKDIFDRLAEENEMFAVMSHDGRLKVIHELVEGYQSAPDIESLLSLRAQFEKILNQFPEISENLRQRELAAVWQWHVKQNLVKPTNILFSLDLDKYSDTMALYNLILGRLMFIYIHNRPMRDRYK